MKVKITKKEMLHNNAIPNKQKKIETLINEFLTNLNSF